MVGVSGAGPVWGFERVHGSGLVDDEGSEIGSQWWGSACVGPGPSSGGVAADWMHWSGRGLKDRFVFGRARRAAYRTGVQLAV